MEKESDSTGDRALRFEHQETLAAITRFPVWNVWAPRFLWTISLFGLQFVDHRISTPLTNSGGKNDEAGISSGFAHQLWKNC
jgi:hypothetical protein